MLRDYRTWLQLEAQTNDFARRALERFVFESAQAVYVPLGRPLAIRVLTTLDLIAQQTTSERPELDALREAIKTALEDE
jgi:hypothetical protein